MTRLFVCVVVLMAAGALSAAPTVPGKLHVEIAKAGDVEIKVQPTDVIELRIPNPALAKKVRDLDVAAQGDAIFAGAVNTSDPKVPGSGRISLFIGLKSAFRSGTVEFSYKDGNDKEHKGKLIIYVTK